MSRKIFRINEFVTNDNNLDLDKDVNRYYVGDDSIFDFKMYVAGGVSYGNGLKKYKKPHFHIIIDKNFNFDKICIYIPTKEEWIVDKRLVVVESTIGDYDDILIKITTWIDIEHIGSFGVSTNLDVLISMWNLSNQGNKNVDII